MNGIWTYLNEEISIDLDISRGLTRRTEGRWQGHLTKVSMGETKKNRCKDWKRFTRYNTVYEEGDTMRPPPHYPDSHYGRAYGGAIPREEERSRGPTSSGSTWIAGRGGDVAASAGKVVLPPVSQLLGEIGARGSQEYDVPSLPRLRVPEQLGEISVPTGRDRDRPEERGRPGEEAGAASSSARSRGRGKKRQSEVSMGETEEEQGKKTKVVRKIYVACDFCRGERHCSIIFLPIALKWPGRTQAAM